MTVFSESDVLSQVFRYFVQQATHDRTLLQLARDFHRLRLAEDAVKLAPQIAPHFVRLLKPAKDPSLFTFSELYEAVSPKLFAAILKDPFLKSETKGLITADRLVGLIDDYVGDRVFEDPTDLEALASVVSWTESDSFQHSVRHRCNWLPAKYGRPLFSEVVTRRRRTSLFLAKEAQAAGPLLSRWYAFAWLSTIRDARSVRSSPTVPIVQFISTLGGLAKPFNPRPYGFVNIFQSVEAISPEFESDGLFDRDKYFMALPNKGVAPLVGFDFGATTRFAIETVKIDTECPLRPTVPRAPRSRKPTAIQAVFKIANSVDGCCGRGEHVEHVVAFQNGKYAEMFPVNDPCSVVAIEFSTPNSKGSPIARLYDLDFDGYFSSQ
jgi:hypothetical protein